MGAPVGWLTRTRHLRAVGLLPAVLWPLHGHLLAITLAAARRRRDEPPPPTDDPPTTRFAVIVPAHDEERLIGETVRSVRESGYPDRLVGIHVIADHCGDRTAEIARSVGATVWDHDDPEPRGKSASLRWALPRVLAHHEPDAVVVLDADSIVEPGFLAALHHHLAAGARVVQARYGVRPAPGAPLVELRAAALGLRHHVRPLGRTALGGSSGLYGNGMAFVPEVLLDRPWIDHLTEDLALQIDLAVDGIAVAFSPEARLHAEMPGTLADAGSQHERWERGRIELVRARLPGLVAGAWRARGRRRTLLVDAALDLMIPPLSVLAAMTVASGGWAFVTGIGDHGRVTRLARWNASALVAALGIHVLFGLHLSGEQVPIGRTVRHAPRLLVWKTLLWVRMWRADEVAWSRTARSGEAA